MAHRQIYASIQNGEVDRTSLIFRFSNGLIDGFLVRGVARLRNDLPFET